ncbi:MAG: nuclease-related domain-containing protein, partial [Egibacteraceae bacterium]
MSLANIDHLAVGPGGVTVIDAENIRGRVRIQRTGGLFTPRLVALRVAGRDRAKLVESVERQMAEVRATLSDLGHPQVSVAGALCLVNVDGLPLFGTLALREV